mgnify:CR=1 FL=1
MLQYLMWEKSVSILRAVCASRSDGNYNNARPDHNYILEVPHLIIL